MLAITPKSDEPEIDWERSKLWCAGNRLIANVAKHSHVTYRIFCLVVPTDGVNYCLLDFLDQRIVGALTPQYSPVKEERTNTGSGLPAASPMLKSCEKWRKMYRKIRDLFLQSVFNPLPDGPPLLFKEGEGPSLKGSG